MTVTTAEDDAPAVDKRSLVAYLEAGCKPPSLWRIGTEHEKLVYRLSDLRPLPYDGEPGIRTIFDRLIEQGWRPLLEDDRPIALEHARGGAITLEPGGQFELSGAPLVHLHQTCAEINRHLAQVKAIGADLGVGFLGVGYQPKWPLDQCTSCSTPVRSSGGSIPRYSYSSRRNIRYLRNPDGKSGRAALPPIGRNRPCP